MRLRTRCPRNGDYEHESSEEDEIHEENDVDEFGTDDAVNNDINTFSSDEFSTYSSEDHEGSVSGSADSTLALHHEYSTDIETDGDSIEEELISVTVHENEWRATATSAAQRVHDEFMTALELQLLPLLECVPDGALQTFWCVHISALSRRELLS